MPPGERRHCLSQGSGGAVLGRHREHWRCSSRSLVERGTSEDDQHGAYYRQSGENDFSQAGANDLGCQISRGLVDARPEILDEVTFPGPLKDGAPVLTVTLDANSPMDVDLYPALHVAIMNLPGIPVHHLVLSSTLRRIRDATERAISRLDRLCD